MSGSLPSDEKLMIQRQTRCLPGTLHVTFFSPAEDTSKAKELVKKFRRMSTSDLFGRSSKSKAHRVEIREFNPTGAGQQRRLQASQRPSRSTRLELETIVEPEPEATATTALPVVVVTMTLIRITAQATTNRRRRLRRTARFVATVASSARSRPLCHLVPVIAFSVLALTAEKIPSMDNDDPEVYLNGRRLKRKTIQRRPMLASRVEQPKFKSRKLAIVILPTRTSRKDVSRQPSWRCGYSNVPGFRLRGRDLVAAAP